MEFRKFLLEAHDPPTDAEMARVLLMAGESVGVKYDAEVSERLVKLAEPL